jgi:2'-5' RNA ligase
MPYAIELAPDLSAAAAVRRLWGELEAAGIPSMAQSGARPHVSLGIWERLERAAFDAELAAFAAATAPLPISLVKVGVFPSVAVFLAPEVTPALLDLHAGFHHRVGPYGSAPWDHYRPGVWVPHCTIAMDLASDQFPAALEIARRAPLPLEGRLVEIGIVEFRPVKQLVSHVLGG